MAVGGVLLPQMYTMPIDWLVWLVDWLVGGLVVTQLTNCCYNLVFTVLVVTVMFVCLFMVPAL